MVHISVCSVMHMKRTMFNISSASCRAMILVMCLLLNSNSGSSQVTDGSVADDNMLLRSTKQDNSGRLAFEELIPSDNKHAVHFIGKDTDVVKNAKSKDQSRTEKIPLQHNPHQEKKQSPKQHPKPLPLELKKRRSTRSANKKRITRFAQQTTPLSTVTGHGLLLESPPTPPTPPPLLHSDVVVITPTTMLLIHPSSTLPHDDEASESPAEQLDDALEDMLDLLRLHGYSGSVLPENMSAYPIGNATEPPEEHEEEEHEEEEEAGEKEAVEKEAWEKEDENEKGDNEYEIDDDHLMTASVNVSEMVSRETDEFEYDDDLKPSGTDTLPYIVHNMSSLASEVYDPYYNYGHQYEPKKHEPREKIQPTPIPREKIQPTPVLGKHTSVKVMGNAATTGNAAVVAGGNATTGSHAKVVDVKKVAKTKHVAEFGGLSASAIFGIIVGTFVGFWLIMGPMVCFLKKVRDHHKEKEKRFTIGPRSGQNRPGTGIMEAMIMTELGMMPHKKKVLFRESRDSSERMSLTADDKDVETFHDAYDTPEHLP